MFDAYVSEGFQELVGEVGVWLDRTLQHLWYVSASVYEVGSSVI
jgi:hypothetical protein